MIIKNFMGIHMQFIQVGEYVAVGMTKEKVIECLSLCMSVKSNHVGIF